MQSRRRICTMVEKFAFEVISWTSLEIVEISNGDWFIDASRGRSLDEESQTMRVHRY